VLTGQVLTGDLKMVARFSYDAANKEFSANFGSTDYLSYKENGYSIKIEARQVDIAAVRNALEALLTMVRPIETAEANEDFSPEYLGISETEVE